MTGTLPPRRPLRRVRPRLALSILGPDGVKSVHEAALEVLGRAGVRFASARCLGILADSGGT
ncbi:MAG TPA: hypothetical protein DEQ28_06680, partial [Clostridiales bacterium]|nr:hypothetical protein [Clostridiales bacterium]